MMIIQEFSSLLVVRLGELDNSFSLNICVMLLIAQDVMVLIGMIV